MAAPEGTAPAPHWAKSVVLVGNDAAKNATEDQAADNEGRGREIVPVVVAPAVVPVTVTPVSVQVDVVSPLLKLVVLLVAVGRGLRRNHRGRHAAQRQGAHAQGG